MSFLFNELATDAQGSQGSQGKGSHSHCGKNLHKGFFFYFYSYKLALILLISPESSLK
jgi:hypothetical protein